MKAENSTPQIKYTLTEGKNKRTLLEKYLSHWTGDERSNGDVNLGPSDLADEFVADVETKLDKDTTEAYQEFVINFDKYDNDQKILDLDNLIKSKTIDDLSDEPLSKESITNIIKKAQEKL